MRRTTPQPGIPTVNGDREVHHLQTRVRIQPLACKDKDVHCCIDDPRRPAPHILARGKPDVDHAENESRQLQTAAAMRADPLANRHRGQD